MPADKVDTEFVRLLWSDLHGVARGKDVFATAFDPAMEVHFCRALLLTDLGANPLPGGETDGAGWPDAVARPTGVRVDHDNVTLCVAELEDDELSPRTILRAQVARFDTPPLVGPELEFTVFKDGRLYQERDTAGYIVGGATDPVGLLHPVLRACRPLGAYGGNQEFGGGQYEVNLAHAPAVTAADRVFLAKYLVKEVAAARGLHATFMGRPLDGRAGNGFHLHISLDAFDDPKGRNGLSRTALSFVAGVLAHAPALSAVLNPTVNAYKRLGFGLAPISAYWGLDNRGAYVRVPPERGEATRVEVRVGDGAANPYLAIAAVLAAGSDGMERELVAPEPVATDRIDGGPPLPGSLGEALAAFEEDKVLVERLGEGFVDAFVRLKRQELDRFTRAVTDWEFREYAWLL
ncbi:glutamine synthetase family protein [Kibdelosporangium lantanae]